MCTRCIRNIIIIIIIIIIIKPQDSDLYIIKLSTIGAFGGEFNELTCKQLPDGRFLKRKIWNP